jgi:outer membrane protein assembly factor BamB
LIKACEFYFGFTKVNYLNNKYLKTYQQKNSTSGFALKFFYFCEKPIKIRVMKIKILLYVFIAALFFGCNKAENWNQYLGPNRNNTITANKILTVWPEQGPEKLWEIKLGPGYGGASIFGNEVYILDREKEESDILRCLDLVTGKEKWNYKYEAKGEIPYPGSRIVPFVDDKNVWTVGPHGHLYCFDKKTQQPVWNVNLQEKFEAERPHWGFSQSPLIYNEMVIVAPQGKKAGIVAFDKLTGAVIWESRPLKGYNFHVSPMLATFGGINQVVMISPYNRNDSTQTQEVISVDVNTGNVLWEYDGLKSFATIAPPTIVDESHLFLTDCSYNGNYNPVSVLIEIKKEGENFVVKELWKTEEAGCKMHPGIVIDEHIYLNNNGRPNEMVCFTMDGKLAWQKQSGGNFEMGSLIKVGSYIINQDGKTGEIALIEPSPNAYKELARASFFDSEKPQAWAPMAFSRGKLLVRDMEKMVCVNLSE